MLIDTATRKERSDFLTEIEMMKKISEGYNNHIVNLVGCVTIQEPLCLITEYVPHGDLLDYLRNQRKKVHNMMRCVHVQCPGLLTQGDMQYNIFKGFPISVFNYHYHI